MYALILVIFLVIFGQAIYEPILEWVDENVSSGIGQLCIWALMFVLTIVIVVATFSYR